MRPRQEQDPLVVRNTPPQDRLEHVVDRSLVSFRDRPDVQFPDQATLAEVDVPVVTKVLLDGDIEPGIGRNEQQDMEVKASIAEDEWGGCGIPLVDLQVGSPDKDRKLVGRGGPRLAVRPGHERRIDPLEFILHRLDDGAARTGKLGERERHQVAGPSAIHPVDDELGVTIHELPCGGINSADPVVFVNCPVGLDRLTGMINLGFVLVEFVPVGFVGIVGLV